MKNQVFLALIFAIVSISLYADDKQDVKNADYISLNTAYENALEFLGTHSTAGQQAKRKAPLSRASLKLSEERPNMYIFDVGDSEGFVVVSASNLTRPVLCYSTDGKWESDELQESLGWLLEQYDAEIAYARRKGAKGTSTLPSIGKAPIEPLIKTLWHQDDPFNRKLTAFTLGSYTYRVKTGCVATAMAQIMNYHQWPKTIKQAIPAVNYGQLVGDDNVEVVVKDVPAGTKIDWEHMNVREIYGDTDPAAIEAVSNLMSYCGTALKMYYGEIGSSSHNMTAMYALKHYFDYDPTIYYAARSDYSYYDWCNLIYNELRAGRPILYNGNSNEMGHSFILDGYDGNEMFHFNLGWNMKSSVYAILSSVGHDTAINNPDAYDSPDGYVYHQNAVMNIQKAGLSEGTYRVSLTTECRFSAEEKSIFYTYFNNEDESYTFDLGIGYRDGRGNLQVAKAYEGVTIEKTAGNTKQYEASSLSFPKGSYRLLPVARLSGGKSEWQFLGNELDYQIASVDGNGKVTLREHTRQAELSVENITFSGHPYAGNELYVFCNVENKGQDDFFDKLYFFWNDNPANKGIDAGHYPLWSHATVNSKGSAPVEFYFTPDRAGEYTIWITTDSEGEKVVGQATVSIGAEIPYQVSEVAPMKVSKVALANLQDGVMLGDDVVVDFDATNTSSTDYFHGLVNIGVLCYMEGSFNTEYYPEGLTHEYEIAPGQTRHFQFSVKDMPFYDAISVKLMLGSWEPIYVTDIYNVEPAVLTYTFDGVKTPFKAAATFSVPESAGAIDLTMVDGVVKKVVPNSNPNTIYYLNEGAAVPSGLEGRNIVTGEQAEKISLDGAYGVAVPKQFNAKSAVFSRQLSKDKWSTLCLPFNYSQTNTQVEIAAVTEEDVAHIHTNPIKKVLAYQTYFVRSKTEGEQKFTASNVKFPQQSNGITTFNNFKAQGVLGKTTVKDVYILNDAGTAFTLKSSADMKPFTSFFMVTKRGYAPSSDVSFEFDATQEASNSIADVYAETQSDRYNLSGQRVNPGYRGIVVEKGRKILMK